MAKRRDDVSEEMVDFVIAQAREKYGDSVDHIMTREQVRDEIRKGHTQEKWMRRIITTLSFALVLGAFFYFGLL